MSYKSFLLQIRDKIATITLNRPEHLNALNMDLSKELLEAVLSCGEDKKVRVVVITGSGKAFSAGGDVKAFKENLPNIAIYLKHQTTFLHKAISNIARMPKPVIAAVNGVAAGGGFSLALACDLTIATESARFVTAYSHIALTPDLSCTYFLPRLVGNKKGLEMLYTNASITAKEALELGIVNQVVPDSEFQKAVENFATQLTERPAFALANTKKLFRLSWAASLETQMENETEIIGQAGLTEDFAEGITAFIEKRKPKFK